MTNPPATSPAVRSLGPALEAFPARYARTARFSAGTPRNLKVIDDGRRVLFCRARSADDAVLCLWRLDVASGTEELVVDPTDLQGDETELPPAEKARRERARESASGIVAYSVDRAARRCSFALAGGLFVVDLATGSVASPGVGEAVFDPRLDPTGTRVAYSEAGTLRIVTLADDGTGIDRELRGADDPLVSFGRAEFVAAEEMGRSRGYWWSPEGDALLVTRVDESPVDEWWIADPAHPGRPATSVRYPAAGTTNATVRLELVDLDGAVAEIDWSDGGRFEYLADVVWQSGHPPMVVRQPRDQRTISLAEIEAVETQAVGRATPAVVEHRLIEDETWAELMPGSPRWCSGGLLTIEDHGPGRGDVRRLVLDGRPISPTTIHVRSIVGVVEGDPGSVVVTAWTDPTEVHLFAVDLPGRDAAAEPRATALTTEAGVHGGVLGASTLIVTSSVPTTHHGAVDVHRLATDAGGADHSLGPAARSIDSVAADPGFAADPTFLELGPDRLRSALFLPSWHDGTEPLPLLLDPYGGPHAQRVLKTHNPHLVSRWFAENGFAVLVTDGRGTPGRGPAWERAVWGDLASPVLDDQVAALDAILADHDFLDPARVAIRGWSFGGYLAALAVLRRPDRFMAALAGAPVTTWRLYDTHYTERYLGHPDEHPEHYDRSDLWIETDAGPRLDRLERPLLLIHGLADDNVVAAHTLRFSTALLATGSPHRVLPLSGVTHMTPQIAVAENLLRLQLDFLNETIGTR